MGLAFSFSKQEIVTSITNKVVYDMLNSCKGTANTKAINVISSCGGNVIIDGNVSTSATSFAKADCTFTSKTIDKISDTIRSKMDTELKASGIHIGPSVQVSLSKMNTMVDKEKLSKIVVESLSAASANAVTIIGQLSSAPSKGCTSIPPIGYEILTGSGLSLMKFLPSTMLPTASKVNKDNFGKIQSQIIIKLMDHIDVADKSTVLPGWNNIGDVDAYIKVNKAALSKLLVDYEAQYKDGLKSAGKGRAPYSEMGAAKRILIAYLRDHPMQTIILPGKLADYKGIFAKIKSLGRSLASIMDEEDGFRVKTFNTDTDCNNGCNPVVDDAIMKTIRIKGDVSTVSLAVGFLQAEGNIESITEFSTDVANEMKTKITSGGPGILFIILIFVVFAVVLLPTLTGKKKEGRDKKVVYREMTSF